MGRHSSSVPASWVKWACCQTRVTLCCGLQLNVRTSIGLGARVNISDSDGKLIAVSSHAIEGGSVAWNVSWSTVSKVTEKRWHDGQSDPFAFS